MTPVSSIPVAHAERGAAANMEFEIVEIDPLEDERWEALAASSPFGSLFHSCAWIEVIRRTYGFPTRAVVTESSDGSLGAGVAYVPLSDPRGRRIVSLPFSDFCDPLVEDSETWRRLVDKLLLDRIPTTFRAVHNATIESDPRFTQYGDARWHGIDLSRPLDDIWKAIGARNDIRKARREGVHVEVAADKSGLREFFDLHLAVRLRKHRQLAQPFAFFEAIWDSFLTRGQGFLLLARLNGRAIAGVLYLRYRNTIYYKFNASDANYLYARPNDLLTWEGLIRAKEVGCTQLDFGLSEAGHRGLLGYKRKFATEEKPIRLMRHTPPGWKVSDEHRQFAELLTSLTELFTEPEVPAKTSEGAGDLLYRFFT